MPGVLYSTDGDIVHVRLNRPEVMNTLNAELVKELGSCLKKISRSDEANILILSGSGPIFSAGEDIHQLVSPVNDKQFDCMMNTISDMTLAFYCMPKLTIAVIHGAAAGLGLTLALAADFVICEADAKLAMDFINIGLIPDGGGHFMLERRLGTVKAKKVIWDGKVMSGAEAAEIGLVDRAVAPGTIKEETNYLLKELAHKPVQAMIKTKKIMADMHRPQLLKTLELEKQGQLKMRQEGHCQARLRTFLEKRNKVFTGSKAYSK